MSIYFDEDSRIFKLDTENTTYMMGLTEEGYLGHIYYGSRLEHAGGLLSSAHAGAAVHAVGK